MALNSVQANIKLIQFRKEITREYIRENPFSPYMGTGMTSIIRTLQDNKKGGEQVNIPIVTRLKNTAYSTGTLSGNEEAIDNYGCRMYVDWARNSVATNNAEEQKDSADLFAEARPLLSDWGKELQRDEIIAAMAALPTESAPANIGSTNGQRTNGILYDAATAGQLNTWASDNSDRVLYGNAIGNYSGTHATDLAKVATTDGTFKAASVRNLKYLAKKADPHIRPFKVAEAGSREYFVAFVGSNNFAQIAADLESINEAVRPREGDGMDKNPILQDGDLLYRGVIIREVPEIDAFVDNIWKSPTAGNLKTGGNGGSRVAPVFLCGQSALGMPWAKMPTPTTRSDTDYDFIRGVGVKMCYGVGKIFKKHSSTKLVQFGMVTGFFSAANPA